MYFVDPKLKYTVQSAAPASGSTVIVGQGITALYISASALITTLTIQLPANPTDGQFLVVGSSQAVTVLTFTGGTVKGALASFTVNAYARYVYSASDGVWFRGG